MAITNSKYKGRDLYLQVEVTAGVYQTVGGLRADSVSIGNEEIDITDKQDDTWKKLLSGGNRTLAVSGSGLVTNANAFEKLQDAANAGTGINAKLVFKSGKAYAFLALIASLELTGEYNGAQQFSASLSAMNTPYIGIAGAVPTLDFRFDESGSIQPTIGAATMTMTRASAALYRDVDGYLKSAGVNVPRFEHDAAGNRMGYLPEPQSTNLLLRSQEFQTTWANTNASISTDGAIAPDQSATADKLVDNVTNGNHYTTQSVSKAASAIQYTLSVFVKAAEHPAFSLFAWNGAGTARSNATFNLTTGAISGIGNAGGYSVPTAEAAPYRDGWWRCSITFTTDTDTTVRPELRINSGSSDTFAGTGTSGIYLWGAQIEAQHMATSYIVTTSAQATRSADVLTASVITGISATEGALVEEFYFSRSPSFSIFAHANNGASDTVAIYFSPGGSAVAVEIADGGVVQASGSTTAPAEAAFYRAAVGWKANDFAFSFNGAAAVTDASGTAPSPTQIAIGHPGTGGGQAPGRPIKRVTYYNVKPANTDIVALAA